MRYLAILALGGAVGLATLGHTQPTDRHFGHGSAADIAHSWVRDYLKRYPGPGEVAALAREIRSRPPIEVLASLLASEEYFARGGGTNAGFITRLSLDVGRRYPEPAELSDLQRRLRAVGRVGLAIDFLRTYPGHWVPGPHG